MTEIRKVKIIKDHKITLQRKKKNMQNPGEIQKRIEIEHVLTLLRMVKRYCLVETAI